MGEKSSSSGRTEFQTLLWRDLAQEFRLRPDQPTVANLVNRIVADWTDDDLVSLVADPAKLRGAVLAVGIVAGMRLAETIDDDGCTKG